LLAIIALLNYCIIALKKAAPFETASFFYWIF
jgi:hypothetical protein